LVPSALTRNSQPTTHNSSAARESRIIRDRIAAYEDILDAAGGVVAPIGSARLLVQVYNGGAMPTAAELVYFTHPVLVTGAETEGGAGTLTADTATTVPVTVLWHAPSVGDYLTAYSVGSRWISERGGSSGGGYATCTPCNIPQVDLTISWTNLLDGAGSTMMTYTSGPNVWSTGCVDNGLEFSLSCTEAGIELRAFFFISGVCPTGETNYCSNLRAVPLGLNLTDFTCSPFVLTFAVPEIDCPAIYSLGNTQFVITL
jgi:hypothetical protein